MYRIFPLFFLLSSSALSQKFCLSLSFALSLWLYPFLSFTPILSVSICLSLSPTCHVPFPFICNLLLIYCLLLSLILPLFLSLFYPPMSPYLHIFTVSLSLFIYVHLHVFIIMIGGYDLGNHEEETFDATFLGFSPNVFFFAFLPPIIFNRYFLSIYFHFCIYNSFYFYF